MALSDNKKGATQMTLSGLSFVTSDYLFQTIATLISLPQFLFLRGLIVSFNMYAIARNSGRAFPKEKKVLALMMARGCVEVYVAFAFLTTLKHVTLADATAINQTVPLVMTVMAYFLFGERFGFVRLTAILMGFIGVLLIIKPGFESFNPYYLLSLSVVFAITIRDLLSRQIPKEVASSWVAFVTVVFVLIASGLFSLYVGWQWVSFATGFVTIIMAILVTFGHLLIVSAMRVGEMNVVASFRYTAILFAVLFDLFLKGKAPDALSILGCILVAAAGVTVLKRS